MWIAVHNGGIAFRCRSFAGGATRYINTNYYLLEENHPFDLFIIADMNKLRQPVHSFTYELES